MNLKCVNWLILLTLVSSAAFAAIDDSFDDAALDSGIWSSIGSVSVSGGAVEITGANS